MTGNASANLAYGGWEYKGCYSSKEGFPGFIPVNVTSLDEATCTSACEDLYRYAALLEECVMYSLIIQFYRTNNNSYLLLWQYS
jgi:hypothetical protein